MKLNFTRKQNSYSLETIGDFAKELSFAFTTGTRRGKVTFVADFALSDLQTTDKIDLNKLDDIIAECSPWYGVKELGEIGFNNDEYRTFVFDYYGGGRFTTIQVDMFDDAEDIEEHIFDVLCDIFEFTKDEANDWLILVQWNEDQVLVNDREQEIDEDTKRIEDAAVKNFAEMLTDYAQGVQAAGYDGIGVEDIQDKLYEYLNWDKKYTPEYEAGRNNR